MEPNKSSYQPAYQAYQPAIERVLINANDELNVLEADSQKLILAKNGSSESKDPPTLGEVFPEVFKISEQTPKLKKKIPRQTQSLTGLLSELEENNKELEQKSFNNQGNLNSMDKMINAVAKTTTIKKDQPTKGKKSKKSKTNDIFILNEKEKEFAHSLFYKQYEEFNEFKQQFVKEYSNIKIMTSELTRRRAIFLAVED